MGSVQERIGIFVRGEHERYPSQWKSTVLRLITTEEIPGRVLQRPQDCWFGLQPFRGTSQTPVSSLTRRMGFGELPTRSKVTLLSVLDAVDVKLDAFVLSHIRRRREARAGRPRQLTVVSSLT